MIPYYFAYFTVPISLIAIGLYIRDMIVGTVKPNRVSWLFWGIAPLLGSYIGYKSGVSIPLLLATFMSGAGCFLVLTVSFFNKNAYWETSGFDIMCGIISALSIIIWLATKNGVVSLSFAVLADLSAGIPTIIKSWKQSETESRLPYTLGVLTAFITILITDNFTFLNVIFPIYLISVNTIIVLGIQKGRMKHN